MKGIKKHNIALWIAAVLFCLVLISTSMNSGIAAKFRTAARGNDRARIAAFSVDAKLIPDNSDPNLHKINFSNDSEVPVSYSIEISLADQAAAVSSVILENETKRLEAVFADGKAMFSNVGKLAPKEDSGDMTLRFVMDPSVGGNSDSEPDFENETTSSSTGEIQFKITVSFTQID